MYTSDAGYLFVGRLSSSDYSFITTEDDTFNFLSFLKISISLKTPKIQFHNEKKTLSRVIIFKNLLLKCIHCIYVMSKNFKCLADANVLNVEMGWM